MTTPTYNSTALTYDTSAFTFDGTINNDLTNLPVLGVFIAFDDEPSVADPNWLEVTSYVRGCSISRGRSDDYSQFQAGTAQVTLDNRDRRFDPFNTASPYNGKLLPRRQIKIVAYADGENFCLFRGYVAGFPVKWTENGQDSTVTVDCFDSFGLIAATEQPADWAGQVIEGLNPFDWFRFDEPEGTNEFKNRGRNSTFSAYINNNYDSYKVETLAPSLPFGSWYGRFFTEEQTVVNPSTSDWSVSAWRKLVQTDGSNIAYLLIQKNNLLIDIYTVVDAVTPANSYFTVVIFHNQQPNWYTYVFQNRYINTEPMHIAFASKAGSVPTIFINGEAQTPNTFSSNTNTGLNITDNIQFFDGAFQDVAIFDYALTEDQIKEIYGASKFGYVESSAARAERILDLTELPAELVNITDNPVVNVAQFQNGGFALPELQRIADSEGGETFVDRNGVLQFVNRWYAFGDARSANVTAIFGESDIPYADTFEIMYDADSIRNEIAVSYSNGAEVKVSDAASIAAYGRSDASINSAIATREEAQDLAEFETTVSSLLRPTISPIQVGNTRVESQWAQILGLDMLNRIQVDRTPATGTAITQQMLVNSIQYDIRPEQWQVRITGSSRLIGWFTADWSLTDGTDVVL